MIVAKFDKNCRLSCRIRDFTIYSDVRPASGGDDTAPEPPEYTAASLAMCVGTYFVFYCNQHDLDPCGFEVSVEPEVAEAPKRFVKYTVNFTFPPEFPEARKKAAKAFATACPVGNTLERGCTVEFNFN
ncbi:MAG: hypothetical protein Kow00107_03440 [Planctomycetota bacterium]